MVKSKRNWCISEDSSDWYILEVDLEYPDEFHYLHNDYLLVPEKIKIAYDMLSDYYKKKLQIELV